MSNSIWSTLLWLTNQTSNWPHYFLGSPTLQLLTSFCWAGHLQIQAAHSPSLLTPLQYPWTKRACWQRSSHHLYSEVGIYRRGISLDGGGREGPSRPRHRLKKHAEAGWLREWQVVHCECSLSSDTSLLLGSASPKFHTLTTHQALHMEFFRCLKPNIFGSKPFSSYTWHLD